jgi:hypothetical protein
MLKERLAAAGFEREEFSGHSLPFRHVSAEVRRRRVQGGRPGRWKRPETVRGYDRRAKLFDQHAGGDFL